LNIDEPIPLEEYDEQWVQHYEAERDRILAAMSDIVVGIEHFGSTSIPGMVAKPIIDILVGVESLALRSKDIERLRRLGYEGFGEAGVASRLYFRKRGTPSYNLAIVEWGKRPLAQQPGVARLSSIASRSCSQLCGTQAPDI
jgi:GrpB-like predicted nucleotidyltransferase (UPF0157 family)